MRMIAALLAIGSCALMASPALADDLYRGTNWPALASDRKASAIGDVVTVIILTNNSASNTVAKGTKRDTALSGNIAFGTAFNQSAGASFGGTFDGQGTSTRADRIAAQLSARVDQVLPNGDLMISGWQVLKVNGETTNIRVSGRIRPQDIDAQNAVLSSRIADANILYDGKGFASRSSKPGLVTRIFRFMGMM